jgi:hypothetical protein
MRAGVLGVLLVVLLCGASGCATRQPRGEALPRIVIQPGAAERIALMDRYRLNDDIRKRQMVRPHTWVEEVPDDELPEPPAADPADGPTAEGGSPANPAE